MDLEKYAKEIDQYRYSHLKPLAKEVSYNLIGLAEEVGEVQAIFKRAIFRNEELDLDHLQEEIGDVFYYLIAISNLMKLNPNQILEKNLEKLESRYNHLKEGEKK